MKRIKILSAVIMILTVAFVLSACSPKAVYGDFEYKIVKNRLDEKISDVPYASIVGLSKEGKTKKYVIIPSMIEDYPVKVAYPSKESGWGTYGKDAIERVYISKGVELLSPSCWVNSSVATIISPEYHFISHDKYDKKGESHIFHYNFYRAVFDEEFLKVNVNFDLNYAGIRFSDRYWVDVLHNEKIYAIPPEPIREGYFFGGWYKEKECLTPWDFDNDVVPNPEYKKATYSQGREYTQCVNRVTLYAKWNKA